MPGITLIDLELEYVEKVKNYLRDAEIYLEKIKKVCKELDPDCRLIVFGSYVRGSITPSSDIDVLLITKYAKNTSYRGKLLAAIAREIGFENPFEIHIVTMEEYVEWYKKFIDVYRELH
ncbi:MAG: nucleotidyltransferase domain-containing protein [Desulfurococcaceae archaeon]